MRPRQHGAALLAAMLTVTLVATLAAGAMWQQWRGVEVEAAERSRTQASWILTGALDWSRLILREDFQADRIDHLAEPWAVPLQEARLSTFLAADPNNTMDAGDAADNVFLSGEITDLQAKLNLANLVTAGSVQAEPLREFRQLFGVLGLPENQLDKLVDSLRFASDIHVDNLNSGKASLSPQRLEQLTWLGVPPETITALEPYVTVLPTTFGPVKVNINTAPAEVLFAIGTNVSLADAKRLVAQREAKAFRGVPDAAGLLPTGSTITTLGADSADAVLRGTWPPAPGRRRDRGALADPAHRHPGGHLEARARRLPRSRATLSGTYNAPLPMSSLVVLLPLEPATSASEWSYALSPDGTALADHGKAPAALLPMPRGAGAEIVAIAPVQALAWHRVDLPKGTTPGSPRLRAALEGLLEEQLLDETDAVHLALGPGARAGAPAWVAVCDRAWLRHALQLLEAGGRPVTRVVPEFAPEGPPALVVKGEPEHPVVVVGSEEGVLALPLTTATLPLLPALPEEAPRVAEPAVAAVAEQLLQQKFVLQQAPQRWVQAARTRWDLAQFEFASSNRARALKKLASGWGEVLHGKPWRPARWAAIVLVAANLLGLNAWAWKERGSLADKREAVQGVLRETFPQVRVIVDAPVQMAREVAALRQQTGVTSPRDLDALLGALASALPAGRAPAKLDYDGVQLRAAGLALVGEETRGVIAQLRTLGYAGSTEGDVLVVTPEDSR